MTDVLYRADINTIYDDYGHITGVTCYMAEHPIVKRTPCGVWIDRWGTKKFVNLQADRKWAWPTKDEAMISLLKRKERQHAIIAHQLRQVTESLKALRAGIRPNEHFRSEMFQLQGSV